MTLLSSDHHIAILALLLVIVALGMAMEKRPRIGQFGVLFIILFPALLSALNVMPRAATVYSIVVQEFVPLSLPLKPLSA